MCTIMDCRIQYCFILFWLFSLLAACSREVETGTILGLRIGSSKSVVLESLVTNPEVSNVQGVLVSPVIVRNENLHEIEKMKSQPGAILEGPKFFLRVRFSGGEVSKVYEAVTNNDRIPSVYDGEKIEQFLDRVTKIVQNTEGFSITAALPDNRWINLMDLDDSDRAYLFSLNSWQFHEDQKYSTVDLIFDNDSLAQVRYRYSPIELP